MSRRVDYHPCIILHHRAWSETSLILDVFSLVHGRLSVMARGARSGRRGQAALLQPLRRLNLSWSGRSEMVTLTGAEAAGQPWRLEGGRLLSAFYLNELLLRLLHRHEPHAELYQAYADSLDRLAGSDDQERVLRLFEKHLLRTLGYGLVLDHETRSGRPVRADQEYYYLFDHGPDTGKLDSGDAVRISGRTLLALHSEAHWDRDIARESKRLLCGIIDSHLDNRPLQSRKLYRAYMKNLTPQEQE